MCSRVLSVLLVMTTAAFASQTLGQDSDPPGLIQEVEAYRGGRHWIDEQPAPPRSPTEALAALSIEPGFTIELVAAEPVVQDPVWLAFDRHGDLYAAEYADYPIGDPQNPDGPGLSRIVCLRDTNQDGRFDHRTVFADRLKFCHSFLPFNNGILAACQTHLIFLADRDGDGSAEFREVWFEGFQPAHPQMQIGCPIFTLSGDIAMTYGPGSIRCVRPGYESDPVTIGRRDILIDVVTMNIRPLPGMGQFGQTESTTGRRYYCTNRNPIMMQLLPDSSSKIPAELRPGSLTIDVGASGAETRVFPQLTMKSNWLSHAGTHTSACGVTAVNGQLFSSADRSSVLVCEPVGHLVTRSFVTATFSGDAYTSSKAVPGSDFLTSSDPWFRPSSLCTGPDGCLYLADFYRQWVEHPKFLPDDIAARIDWRAGADRGRIYRIRPSGTRPLPVTKVTPENAANMLLHPSDWYRRQARQLLRLQPNQVRVQQLRKHLRSSFLSPVVRMHLLEALDDCTALTVNDLILSIQQLDGRRLGAGDCVALILEKLRGTRDADAVTRACQHPVVFAMIKHSPLAMHQWLACLPFCPEPFQTAQQAALLSQGVGPYTADSVVAGCGESAVDVLRQIATQQTGKTPPSSWQPLARLAQYAARNATAEEKWELLKQWGQHQGGAAFAVLEGMQQGGGPLSALIHAAAPSLPEAEAVLRQVENAVRKTLADRAVSEADRAAAARLLDLDGPTAAEWISQGLSSLESAEVQTVLVSRLMKAKSPERSFEQIAAAWPGLKPTTRAQWVAECLRRINLTEMLLKAMQSERLPASAMSLDQRLRLLKHPQQSLRTLATAVFGKSVSSDRVAVAERYRRHVSATTGDALQGREIFRKNCSQCHRLQGIGQSVGPDLADVAGRSDEALLYDILDPNRRVDPQYTAYTLLTPDGQTLNGLLQKEDSSTVTLLMPEGKTRQVPRGEIEEITSGNKSLMPEGVELAISPAAMSDLLAFLRSR